MKAILKKLTSLVSTSTLLLGFLISIPLVISGATTANAVTCNATAGTLVPVHRSSTDAWNSYRPFYADTKDSTTPKSGYVGYVVSGALVSSVTDLWIGISGFSDVTKLTKSTNQSAIIPSRDFFKKSDGTDDTTKRLAYFYLYAPNNTNTPQTFTVTLYNGNPAIGGTTICSDTDGFSSVNDVISANANKITGVTVSNSTPVIGSDFSVTATGQTGTLGRGPTDDRLLVNGNNIGPISLSPSMADNWKADAFTLIGIKFRYDIDNNGTLNNDAYQYNWLRYYPTSTASKLYDVTYYFTVRAVASNVPVRPVQNIVSGTQVKYTGSYSGSALTASITSIKDKVSINKTVKSVTAVNNSTGDPQFDLVYQLKLRNNATVESTIDYLKDTISINMSSVTGGAFVSPLNGGTLTLENTGSISNLLVKASTTTNQMVLNFNGPIVLSGLSASTIEYKVRVSYPSTNTSMPINNQVIGYIGSETITATSGVNAVNINLKATVTLTIVKSADGYVSTDVLQTNGTACTSNGASEDTTCTFYSGTALTLTATSGTGTNTISKWLTTGSSAIGTCTATNAVNPCSFVMTANQTITPVFGQSYVVTVVGAANVDVSDGSATLFSCTSGTCTKTFPAGATPRISFTPAPGFVVNTITTNASSPSAATINSGSTPKNVDLTVNTDIQLTLGVGQTSYVLDVTVLTAGGNTVSSSPSGISLCDSASGTGTCSAAFATGTSVTLTAAAKSAGNPSYSFANWGGDCSGSSTCTITLNADKAVTASFSSTAKFTVTFDNNSSTFTGATGNASPNSSQQGTAGAAVNLATVGTMTLSGYTFNGWATDPFGGPISGSTITPTSNITLYAVWVQDIYSVTYDGNTSDGGTVPSDSSSPYVSGDVVTVLGNSGTLTKTGHTFNNWNTAANGSGTSRAPNATFIITSSVTLYAQWTPNTYTVTYDGNNKTTGTVPSNQTKTYGVNLTLATNSGTLARTGYTFSGWNTQADGLGTTYAVSATYSLNAGITLYAKWTADTYTVTYGGNGNTGGAAPSNQTKTYGTDLTLSTNSGSLARTGYTFAGWNTAINGSGTDYLEGANYSTNAGLTLYAKWTANTYTVTFDGNGNTGGSVPANQTKTHAITLVLASNTGLLAKTGSTFAGWNTAADGSGTNYLEGANYTNNAGITLYAKWTVNTYTVTYNGNSNTGGTVPSNQTKTYAVDLTLAANTGTLVRTGYTFDGWYTTSTGTSGTAYAAGTGTYSANAGITLYAKWNPNTYTLIYDGNSPASGSTPANATYTSGSTAITMPDNTGTLTKTGYTFHGWYSNTTGTGGTSYSVGSTLTITQDTTVYVHWILDGAKTVTFNKNDLSGTTGSQSASMSTALSSSSALRARTGYSFAGWNTLANGNGTNYLEGDSYSFAADITLYAQWVPVTYAVTYNANSSTLGTAPSNQTKTHAVDLTLQTNSGTLARTGYTFGGWNTEANGSGTSYAAAATYATNAGLTLFAKWTINTYTVTYDGNGESSGSVPIDASSPYNYNATITVLGNSGTLSKTGYTFAGWNTAANGTGTSQVATSTFTLGAANVTLYAQWTADAPASYTVTYATNSSDGGTAPANTTGNGSVTLRTNSGNLTRSGYTFGGWNTGTGCSGTNYSAGASFNLTSSVTLYPCWNTNSTPTPTPDPEPTPEPQPRNNAPAKIKPVVVWKNPNAIKTTTTLSTVQLNALATTSLMVTPVISNPATPDKLPSSAPTIAGTYIYTPIVPTVVTAGVNQVTTVTSAQNALTGTTKTVQTTTTPSVPTNTSSTTNVEEKPVLGQGTTLAPGLQKMKVVFIPADSTTYEPVETEVEILVQAETKVNWVNPAPIKKTTPVGPGQLNATGIAPGLSNNVPGAYKYEIPEGTTLPPGKYPVKVTFTPTDPNYLPSTGEVTITVVADINPLATPIVTPSNTPAGKPITNTTPAANAKVTNVGKGLINATTNGTEVNIVPEVKFSGKTNVVVTVTDEGETKDVVVPVTVLPLPAVTPLTTPNTKGKSTIAWKPSPNAVEYEVTLAGKSICTTTTTSCSTAALIGPKSDVKVVAKGNDETVAPVAPAKYTAPKKPVTALVVYFDTNKFNLDAKDKADIRAIAKVIIEQGFKNIVVNGHTDIRGGVDNQVLSRNRSNATFNYLKELVPGLNVTIGAFASTKPAVKGTSAEALASNRRAEVGVY